MASDSGPRLGSGPNDSLPIPDVLSRGTWLGFEDVDERKLVGVFSSPARDEADDPAARFRERMVTVDGKDTPWAAADLGDARGGVCVGAGSFDLADCTLASSRCICAVSERICVRELEAGSLCFARLGLVIALGAGVRRLDALPETRGPWRALADLTRGFGVMLLSRDDGRRDLRESPLPSLAAALDLAKGAEASDIGGDGGS